MKKLIFKIAALITIASVALVGFPSDVLAVTLFENLNTGDDSEAGVYGAVWRAQTFTPASAHTITSVKIKGWEQGTITTLTLSIRATDGSSHPTGADLTSGTYDASGLGGTPAWFEVPVTEYTLAVDTKYAIVVRIGEDTPNEFEWRLDNQGGYASGTKENSSDSGANWDTTAGVDMMFEVWGNAIGGGEVAEEDDVLFFGTDF